MNADRAGGVKGTLMNGRREVCAHQRLVDEHVNEQGMKTGRLVCRECGEVIQDTGEGLKSFESLANSPGLQKG